ncbi:glycosyltransferase family 4 protein [Elongatibacter sediminis]
MGGAERQAFHLIRYLRERRDARIAVLGWYGTEGPLAEALREWGCELFTFPYQGMAPKASKAWNLFQLARFIKSSIRPDYILPFVAVHSKPICQIWRLTGARYAWWNQQDEGRGLFGTGAERRALLNAAHITSNSWAGSEFLAQTYRIPKERILTYNNGTELPDTDRLQPTWRKQLGISSGTPLVSMVANITPYKDHATLLQAWRVVLQSWSGEMRPAPVLALVGHQKVATQVARLKVLAFDMGLGTSVRFIGSIDTVKELMCESDLVVHSSLKEGCPNAVCEAMALGKPVVATDIPGTRQALDESTWRDCLAAPKDAEALAQRILTMLKNPDMSADLGARNRQRIKQHFSIEGMCAFFLSLLEQDAAPANSRHA